MFRFGVKNMRRLKDVPLVQIKPITILVGRNSSGKSTFLRTFPLIRQSINTRTSSPILWYGDLVDFGEYTSVVSGRNPEDCITLSFGVDEISLAPGAYFNFYEPPRERVKMGVDLDIVMSGNSGKAKIESIRVHLRGRHFVFEIEPTGELKKLFLDDRDVTSYLTSCSVTFSPDALFPELAIRASNPQETATIQWYMANYWASRIFSDAITPHVNQRIKSDKIYQFASQFLEMNDFSSSELLKLERKLQQRSIKSLINAVRTNPQSSMHAEMRAVYDICKMLRVLPATFNELRGLLSKTLYIGPMRARSERYYRYQDLAVAEIDPDGKNFPMFLNSLTSTQRHHFSEWVHEQFGYGVEVKSESGHISINLVFGSEKSNIVDNGYGISQVLPVLGQIWWAAYRNKEREENFPPTKPIQTTIVIEQPELHLHPAHQSLLADAIIKERAASDLASASSITFVVETHSEALVNRLGQLIADGKIPHEDVQVLVFEDDKRRALTTVRTSTFDVNGTLENWPFGFFQAETL